jgi:hypothetical protein
MLTLRAGPFLAPNNANFLSHSLHFSRFPIQSCSISMFFFYVIFHLKRNATVVASVVIIATLKCSVAILKA